MKHIAVVGAGYWGQNLVRNFHELGALRTICDATPQILNRYEGSYPDVQRTGSFSDVMADQAVAGVVIATPAATHFDLVKDALLAGKDVFVEKPMSLQRNEGEILVRLAADRGRILMVGHVLQYHPAVRRLKEVVDAGVLGKVQYIYSNRLNIGKIRSEENILWSFAPHDISIMLMLLGESPHTVSAHGGNYLHHDRADVTMTTLTFPSGARGHIFVSWLHPYKDQRLVVVGDRGMIVFNDLEPTDKVKLYPHRVDWIDRKPVAHKAEGTTIGIEAEEPLRLECREFLEAIATRQQPRTNGSEGLAVLEVLEACQRSLDQHGLPVALTHSPAPTPPPSHFVHPSAFVDEGCEIGEGTKIWHVSHILKDSKIGRHCNIGQNVVIGPKVTIGDKVKIQNNVSVYQGVTLEDEVFCGPSMVFTNVINPRSGVVRMHELKSTLVKRGASIGANATIVCGTTLGSYSFVGAGAVVTKDVPDHALVIGNPARIAGWMCQCGVRLKFVNHDATCTACGATYAQENGRVLQVARTA